MQTWVERPIHLRFDGGGSLTQSEAFKLCGEVVDLAVELTRPDGSHGLFEAGSVRFADLLAGHCPRKGGGGPVVALGDLGPGSLLEDELLLGQEIVRIPHVEGPDLIEHEELFFGVESEVADQLAHMGPVLLLDVGPVVLVARARPGEGDLVLDAVVEQVVVDELTSVVRIDAEYREGELRDDVLDGLEDPDGPLAPDPPAAGPTGENVSNGEGEAELAARVASLVADQVDFDEPGHILAPLGPGADRDLRFEQRAGLGV